MKTTEQSGLSVYICRVTYLIVKAFHIIFVVTWFAGLFYIVRLFIYHVEAGSKEQQVKEALEAQYKIMEKRLWYGITWPSMILTVCFGTWLIILNPVLLKFPFMHLKLTLVVGLVCYHLSCHRIFKRLQNDSIGNLTSIKMRVWNEVATLFLFAIVFVIVLKQQFDWRWGLAGLLVLAGLIFWMVKAYQRKRRK